MEMPAYHQQAPVQQIRSARGVMIGRLEHQKLTNRTLARDARGVLVGTYDHRSNTTRTSHGVVVGTGNLLPALIFAPR